MSRKHRPRAALVAIALLAPAPALAQKVGGTLRIYHRETPPSASPHEESTTSTLVPFMGLFNNLVIYDQTIAQNSDATIRPDLAESWSWDDSRTRLTFKLRHGVKWHDGKPFTAADVKCTWDLLQGKAKDKLRKNPHESWWFNLSEVTTEGEDSATFVMKRPQPAVLAMLASGYSPVYPCHVPPAQMRTKPVGTGPFKFGEMKANESIRVVRNPDYWKPGRPYVDAIEYTIIRNRSTAVLAFIAGNFDMTFPFEVTNTITKDIRSQAPASQCAMTPMNDYANLLLNREAPPFDNPDLRRALSLSLDHQAFIDILGEGIGDIGGYNQPPPEGIWGMPPEEIRKVTGYSPDVAKRREEARALMRKLGWGPEKRMPLKISARNIPFGRDPAVILVGQLKEIYVDAELDLIETANWYAKLARKDYAIALNTTGNGIDDPDQNFYENFSCKSERNYSQYCDPEMEKLFERQSVEPDPEKRRQMVWDIDRKLLEEVVRPPILWLRQATCWQPRVKGFVAPTNSLFNGWRWEDVWLDG